MPPVLKQGATGGQVVYLQTLLNKILDAGAAPVLKTDGDFGAKTAANVSFFQSISGLPVNGVVDDAVWNVLINGSKLDPLAVDLYIFDGRNADNVRTLGKFGKPWHVFWPQVTNGLQYMGGESWLDAAWKAANGDDDDEIRGKLGQTWFTSLYHYFLGHVDALKQADLYLKHYERLMGLLDCAGRHGFIGPVIDVEEGQQLDSTSDQQLIDGVSTFAERVRAVLGKPVIRYSGWWLAGKKLKNRMNCDLGWIAAYTSTFPRDHWANVGWSWEEVFAWQYAGDGYEVVANYPGVSPGTGPEDISAILIDGGGEKALARMRLMAAA